MELKHIEYVIELEREAFPTPWPKNFFFQDLQSDYAQNFVSVLENGVAEKVVGYICAWTIHDECSINKIACHCRYRRMGIGAMLLKHLMKESYIKGARIFSLEVREFNIAAQSFYQKFNFIKTGIRKGYYSDTKEDAIVMGLYVSELLDREEKQQLSERTWY
jgi:ribosomal-protein-alanine N-acetyltransferase